ncbi:hypothetical protein EXW96_18585 [Paenibacillus sp. JMULE4]|uniref:CopC domain-containing protein n=1 Tax=Paenibacillus validus TaxID=44253 RepID=A0A7X2ZDP5_9BACL|nr:MULTISPECIES: copper resistance CopC family protein [Paenibacillus]MUG73034.1 hypothetical protein [Paenibacillus validus]NTZ19497.1 hypothetical protein [Paenibacillus sp. JMULE4]
MAMLLKSRQFKQTFWLTLLSLFLSLILSVSVTAHTGLEASNPKDGEEITTELKEISLTFAGKVENLSTFKLLDSSNQNVDVTDIQIKEKTMSGKLAQPLANGSYQVQWTIVGEDGHPIKGQFSFNVNVPESKQPVAEPAKQPKTPPQTPTEPEQKQPDTTTAPATPQSSGGNTGQIDHPEDTAPSSNTVVYLLGALAILVAISLVVLTRRKK